MLKNKRSAIWKLDRNEFIKIFNEKETLTEILNHFGIKMHGANNKTLKERIKHEGLDISILEEKRKLRFKENFDKGRNHNNLNLKDILVKNSKYTSTSKLKNKLLKEGLLKNECYECGLSNSWNGKSLSLHLDHIDGDRRNNLLSNLQLLCPNCHSQTDTYCGKAKRKYYQCKECGGSRDKDAKNGICSTCYLEKLRIKQTKVQNRPSKNELTKLILTKPFTEIGKDYHVSDNAIRKWCKAYDLPSTKKDIKAQREQLEQLTEKELVLT